MNVVIPFEPFSGADLAYTTSVDAVGPFVILAHGQLRVELLSWSQCMRAGDAPKLVPVQPPAAVALLRAERHADHVAPAPGLAHRETADLLARDEVWQVLLLLRLRAPPVDLRAHV